MREKLNAHFAGKIVRKDLTKLLKEGANVPIYVLEYLLGMYCVSEDIIDEGIERVKNILANNFVRPDESEIIKSKIKEKGRYKIIDKISAKLNEKQNVYLAEFQNLGIKNVLLDEEYVKKYPKILSGGIWGIITMEYIYEENSSFSPFHIEELKPIQMAYFNIDEFREKRGYFTKDEWIDLIIRGIGMEPNEFSKDVKWHILARVIPFVENNYNLTELGPRGTGKSFVYKEVSPYTILVSGGQTTVANLFYNMASKQIGLVGNWDVVAFDEVAGIKFKDKDGIQIMKDYMESGSFVRGKNEIIAKASFVFVGNIDGSIANILKSSHLFSPFPKEMIDSAFFDRFHGYIPGWEIPKMRPEFFTNDYGFISDYLAEAFRNLQKFNFSNAIDKYFRFGKDLNQRDIKAVKKSVSGLLKIIYPNEKYSKEDVKEVLEYALKLRKRVKEQLKKIGGMEFYDVNFSYIDIEENKEIFVNLKESSEKSLIPNEVSAGTIFFIGTNPENSHKGLIRLDLQIIEGNGKFEHTGFSNLNKDELKEALSFIQANLKRVTSNATFKHYDYHIRATDLNYINKFKGSTLSIFISLCSGILDKKPLYQMVILGSMNIGGAIIPTDNLADTLQIAVDSGAKKVLIPAIDMVNIATVKPEILSKVQLIIYQDPIDAVYKALGVS